MKNKEIAVLTNEALRVDQEKHALSDVPPFDPEAATRRIDEAKQNLANKTESSKTINDGIWESLNDGHDEYDAPDSASDLEKSATWIPKYERLLSSPGMLQIISKEYLEQYQPNPESRADILFCKDMLDHYVLGQLSGDNAKSFIESDRFKNYSSHIISVARQKIQTIYGKNYYPELATNPVLRNPEYRKLIISMLRPADQVDAIVNNLNENEAGYRRYLNAIESRLDNGVAVSQGELNMAGDYLYSSRDFNNGLAKKFACYMFNDASQRRDLNSSTQICGALANYFAYKNTLDDRIKERRIVIANNTGWDSNNNALDPVNVGVSTRNYCVLEQDVINNISLSSEEGLSKSRPKTITDLYSLEFVSYHELTHDYEKYMVFDGKSNSSAMSYILNQVLRRNQSECFPIVDKNLDKVLDKNGKEVKAGYYQANHDSDEIEIQADEEAWRQCRKFIGEHEREYSWSKKDSAGDKRAFSHLIKCKDNEQEVRVRRTFALKVDENGQEMPYIQYDIQQLEKSIKEGPEIIKQFPQLAEFFDNTGHIKPEIFFDKDIASVDMSTRDEITDNFGVEIATYALMDNSDIQNILSYIQAPHNNLNYSQITRCLTNLWNVLHQNTLRTRPLKDINFNNYSDTATRGKNIDLNILRESYLKQYLHQLFNATYIAEVLRSKYPEADRAISQEEQIYYISYYDELAKGINLEPAYAKMVKDLYTRTNNPALQQIATRL